LKLHKTLEVSDAKALMFASFIYLPVVQLAMMFDSLFVQPFIYSKSVKAHPLEIFFAIFAGATLAGGLGMLLAIPAYTILRVGYLELRASMQQYRVFRGS
jgi:predicted PurR-regulated permease PerM